jgi:ubiquitin-protein ligase
VSIPDQFREQDQVLRLFPQQAKRVLTLDCLTGTPPRLEVRHRGFVIEPRFPFNYPYEPPHIYLRPGVHSLHYYVHQGEQEPRLCWCQPSDWSPRMGLLVAVCSAMRFINDYLAHRVN